MRRASQRRSCTPPKITARPERRPALRWPRHDQVGTGRPTPITESWGQRAETACDSRRNRRAGAPGTAWSRRDWGRSQKVGGRVGGRIADATDPRLRRGRTAWRARWSRVCPPCKLAAPVVKRCSPPRSPSCSPPPILGARPDPAALLRLTSGARCAGVDRIPSTPVTAGQLGGRFIKTIENWLGKIPLVGAPIHSAQANVEDQIRQTRTSPRRMSPGPARPLTPRPARRGGAPQRCARLASTTPSTPPRRRSPASRTQLGTANTHGPGGGSAMVDPRGLINELNGMKTDDRRRRQRSQRCRPRNRRADRRRDRQDQQRPPAGEPGARRPAAKQDRRVAELSSISRASIPASGRRSRGNYAMRRRRRTPT